MSVIKDDGTVMTTARVLQVEHRGQQRTIHLVTIDNDGHELDAPAAASWLLMADDAGSKGVSLRARTAWRSREYQQRLRDKYERWVAYQEALKRGERPEAVLFAPLAAKPGWSEHEIGNAIDVRGGGDPDSPETHYLNENAERFGWVRTVASELWHFAFRPERMAA